MPTGSWSFSHTEGGGREQDQGDEVYTDKAKERQEGGGGSERAGGRREGARSRWRRRSVY